MSNNKLTTRNIFPFFLSNFPFFDEEDQSLLSSISPDSSNLSIYEDDSHVYVEAGLPGIKSADIEITFEKGVLWIRGDKKESEEDKNKKYYRKASQSYSYRVAVPGNIDENVEPEAIYKDGVMVVKFSKQRKSTPKKIQIKSH